MGDFLLFSRYLIISDEKVSRSENRAETYDGTLPKATQTAEGVSKDYKDYASADVQSVKLVP